MRAIRTLLWDLSYFLPTWLLTPVLLLGLALIGSSPIKWLALVARLETATRAETVLRRQQGGATQRPSPGGQSQS